MKHNELYKITLETYQKVLNILLRYESVMDDVKITYNTLNEVVDELGDDCDEIDLLRDAIKRLDDILRIEE